MKTFYIIIAALILCLAQPLSADCTVPTDLTVVAYTPMPYYDGVLVFWQAVEIEGVSYDLLMTRTECNVSMPIEHCTNNAVFLPYSLFYYCDYSFQVRSVCSDGTLSDWSEPTVFFVAGTYANLLLITQEKYDTVCQNSYYSSELFGEINTSVLGINYYTSSMYECGINITHILELLVLPHNTTEYFNEIDTIIKQGEFIEIGGQIITQNGRYTDTLVTINDCDSVLIINTMNVTILAGLELIDYQTNISIYPNPANSTINIELENIFTESIITVTNLQGKIIKQLKLSTLQKPIQIDVSDISDGFYMINIIADKTVKTAKLIINHY
ncbi:MAG: T9SS type A sorting domain-containing protein [Prevotellaceae bacterium]|jgi:hypothetical protein|nr:T9SS type A sorting domain-containing protein [Prevotellaceae bacterium]